MIELHKKAPSALRLLRSAQVALPMTDDFWGDLAKGLVLSSAVLENSINRLYENGHIHGAWGEPNPAFPETIEQIISDRDSGVHRWTSSSLTSVATGKDIKSAWQSVHWWKAGALPDWNLLDDPNMFAPSKDRTSLVADDEHNEKPPLTYEQRLVYELLQEPIVVKPPQTPWQWLAERDAQLTPESARRAVAGLVIARRWRRFALRLNHASLGWEGCGLACWNIEEESIGRAAGALASIRCTGDVCQRKPTEEYPFNLTALIIAQSKEEGHSTAERIGEQWKRPLEKWIPLELK